MARNFMTKDGKINRQNESEIGKVKYNKSIMLFLFKNVKRVGGDNKLRTILHI